jgi:hypothetical protein
MIPGLVKKFIEVYGTLPFVPVPSQTNLFTPSCPTQDLFYCYLFIHSCILEMVSFLQVPPQKVLYGFVVSPVRATCAVYPTC